MPPPDPEKRKAAQQAWRRRNVDRQTEYSAAYRERNPERARAQNRASAKRFLERKKADKERRRRAVERAKKSAVAHPEQVALNKRRWAAANPDKVRQAQREYQQRNRDAVQQRSDAWLIANPDKVAIYKARAAGRNLNQAANSRQRRADPEKNAHDLEVSRDRRRLARRLTAQSLPPARLQKVPAAQRRANGAAARDFFARVRTASEIGDLIRREDAPPSARQLDEAARIRHEMRRQAVMKDRISGYLSRHGERVRREIEMDSRARELRGVVPLDPDSELVRRVRLFADSDNVPLRAASSLPLNAPTRARSGSRSLPQQLKKDRARE